ncbi:uncharacterized protein LOC122248696 [Penaeus japonicus]|uniref:uncharacterized protein LOC122248696 n=1 Tax=Penaeus japonicus TaxID=27405 RepID=UPI001C710561|nr:uncharacterized protein LOC122248696 [Penaeus japonicus]
MGREKWIAFIVSALFLPASFCLEPERWSNFVLDYAVQQNTRSVLALRLSELNDQGQQGEWNHFLDKVLRRLALQNIGVSAATLTHAGELVVRTNTPIPLDDMGVASRPHESLILAPLLSASQASALRHLLNQDNLVTFVWLLVTDDSFQTHLKDVFLPIVNKVTIAWENGSQVVLSEIYQLSPVHDQRESRVGAWSPPKPGEVRGHLETPSKDITFRRSDLSGLHLTCVVVETWPYVTYKKEYDGTLTSFGGFHYGIWEDMKETLNFSYTCHEAPNSSWGVLIDELATGVSDVTFAPVTMMGQRLDIIDLSLGITENYYVMATRRQEGIQFSWKCIFRGVSSGVAIVTLMTLVGMAFVVTLISRLSPSEPAGLSVAEALTFSVGALAGQGYHRSMYSTSGRIAMFSVFAFTLLVYYHYTALLTSTLAVTWNLPFRNPEELVNAGTHRLIFRETAISRMFETSADETISRIWEGTNLPIDDSSVIEYGEGLWNA